MTGKVVIVSSLILIILINISNGIDPLLEFWGVSHVTVAGISKETNIAGYANIRWNISHSLSSRFPIASNTKLFTAISIYQLQEKGLLNVNDPIQNYLDHNDFIKFGYPNITYYCPMLLNQTQKQQQQCQNITFKQLMSMSSGIPAIIDCPYRFNKNNTTSPFLKYCINFCQDLFIPYQGSLAYYVAKFINLPLTMIPGNKFEYSNPNFILCGYIIEKLTNLSYSLYVDKYILSPLNMTDTYYDNWDGQFGINLNRVDEYYLFRNEQDLESNNSLGIGWCAPYQSLSVLNTAGAMVSTNVDMHKLYTTLFNPNIPIPIIFKDINTRKELIYPYTFFERVIDENDKHYTYYAQGVYVTYYNESNALNGSWPNEIWYLGVIECSCASIKMIPNDTMLVVSSMSNAPNIFVHDGMNGFNKLKYNTPESICEMFFNKSELIRNTGSAPIHTTELLLKWMGK